MQRVKVYLKDNSIVIYYVETEHQAREHAKRIISEGFQWDFGDGMTWYPVHWVMKVKTPDLKTGTSYPLEPTIVEVKKEMK